MSSEKISNGAEPGQMTQTFIAEGPGAAGGPARTGCHNLLLTLITGYSNTHRYIKRFLVF